MAEPRERKEMPERKPEGWWEYGVGGVVMHGTGKPVEPTWEISRLSAEIRSERHERLYVVRRWVTPGVWEKVDSDDHPGVDDWSWEQYLEWRDKQLVAAGEQARGRREAAATGAAS